MSLRRIQKKYISCITKNKYKKVYLLEKFKASSCSKWKLKNKIIKRGHQSIFCNVSIMCCAFYMVFLFVWNFEYTHDLTYLCMHFPYLIGCFIFYYIFYRDLFKIFYIEKSLATFEFQKLFRHFIVIIFFLKPYSS